MLYSINFFFSLSSHVRDKAISNHNPPIEGKIGVPLINLKRPIYVFLSNCFFYPILYMSSWIISCLPHKFSQNSHGKLWKIGKLNTKEGWDIWYFGVLSLPVWFICICSAFSTPLNISGNPVQVLAVSSSVKAAIRFFYL